MIKHFWNIHIQQLTLRGTICCLSAHELLIDTRDRLILYVFMNFYMINQYLLYLCTLLDYVDVIIWAKIRSVSELPRSWIKKKKHTERSHQDRWPIFEPCDKAHWTGPPTVTRSLVGLWQNDQNYENCDKIIIQWDLRMKF